MDCPCIVEALTVVFPFISCLPEQPWNLAQSGENSPTQVRSIADSDRKKQNMHILRESSPCGVSPLSYTINTAVRLSGAILCESGDTHIHHSLSESSLCLRNAGHGGDSMVDLRLLNSSGAFRRDLECHWAGPVRGREACPERGARCATVVHVGPVAHAWPTHPPTQKLHPHFLHPQIGEGRCCDTLDKKCTRMCFH